MATPLTFHDHVVLQVLNGLAAGTASIPAGLAVKTAFQTADFAVEAREKAANTHVQGE